MTAFLLALMHPKAVGTYARLSLKLKTLMLIDADRRGRNV